MYDQNGRTPLHLAAYNRYTAVATLLLDRGASIDTADNVSHIVCMTFCKAVEGKRRCDAREGIDGWEYVRTAITI